MINIDLNACCGCLACKSLCSSHAIDIEKTEDGFYYPKINSSDCINCRLCEKICPVIHIAEPEDSQCSKAYGFINKDEAIRNKSSSGGFFTAAAHEILNNDGIVFGARFDDNLNVYHDFTDEKQNLHFFNGAKYVQSNTEASFQKCKEYLEKGITVLYSGVPCQIAALKNFLKKDYSNLYTLDMICHGIPSPKLWNKYLEFQSDSQNSKVIDAAFRVKDPGWKDYSIVLKFEDGSQKKIPHAKDEYMKLFLKNFSLRKSCYECKYKGINRISDITMADFWGIQNLYPQYDDNMGTSLILTHTQKGEELLKEIENCSCFDVDIEKAAKYNPSLITSCQTPKNRSNFFQDLDRMNFNVIARKYTKSSFSGRIKKIIKKIIKL